MCFSERYMLLYAGTHVLVCGSAGAYVGTCVRMSAFVTHKALLRMDSHTVTYAQAQAEWHAGARARDCTCSSLMRAAVSMEAMRMPMNAAMHAVNRPKCVAGNTSPYPTCVCTFFCLMNVCWRRSFFPSLLWPYFFWYQCKSVYAKCRRRYL